MVFYTLYFYMPLIFGVVYACALVHDLLYWLEWAAILTFSLHVHGVFLPFIHLYAPDFWCDLLC